MHFFVFHHSAALTVAFALAAGMLGQSLAHHLRLPGIVMLLVLGVVLGPDGANLVRPAALGEGLPALVGFAVAVILFEGGMSLNLRRLRRSQRAIRRLVTVGALVSLIAGTVLVRVGLGWDWERSLLFGTLVIVTGPTVITPLLRRLKVKKPVSTVLEAEGVLIDAVGAITAAVALEVVLTPTDQGMALAVPTIIGRLLFGIAFGVIGGGLLALLLRFRGVIPGGIETVMTLSVAVLVFEGSNAVVNESGIAAVTVAGVVVGNSDSYVARELREFKEQLTTLFIGMLFVLLVADVRLADILALGTGGLLIAVGTIVLVRPLSVALSTMGTELSTKERIFVAWLGPRGIVAAAVASLIAYALEGAGIEGGRELSSLVFLVIAVTVGWAALTGGVAARALNLKRKSGDGWVVVGGSPLARQLCTLLASSGGEVLAVDNDPGNIRTLEHAGLRALQGNALEEGTHLRAQLDTRTGAIAVTANEEVNYLFGEKARLHHRGIRFVIGLAKWDHGVTPEMVDDFGGEVLFGAAVDVALWSSRLEAETCVVVWHRFVGNRKSPRLCTEGESNARFVPLVTRRHGVVAPVTDHARIRPGTEVAVLIDSARAEAAANELAARGWVPIRA
ncbi:MAG: cation:proton antiporter [Myxococcota bacterium]|nr:cation:proton antiporter [Myxococcota bacterium]